MTTKIGLFLITIGLLIALWVPFNAELEVNNVQGSLDRLTSMGLNSGAGDAADLARARSRSYAQNGYIAFIGSGVLVLGVILWGMGTDMNRRLSQVEGKGKQ